MPWAATGQIVTDVAPSKRFTRRGSNRHLLSGVLEILALLGLCRFGRLRRRRLGSA